MKKFSCRYPAIASFLILLFCIAGLLMNGCSKKDQNEKQTTEVKPAPASTFFTAPSSTDPFVNAIAAILQRKDMNGDIELQLSRHAGLPKWDYALVAVGTIADAGKGETGQEDSVKVALIPFVMESYKQTTAMMMVKISSSDTSYRLIYAGQYEEFGFGRAQAGKWNAFNLFHLFTRFDNAIFGHKKFLVKDKKILNGLGAKNQETAIVELVGNKNTAAKLVRVPYCTDYDVCLRPCPLKPTAARTQPCCLEWATRSYCTEVWIDDGNPTPPPVTSPDGGSNPFPPPGGGFPGGGSGSGGGTPVIDPCTLNPNGGGTPDYLCFVPDGGWQPVFSLPPAEITSFIDGKPVVDGLVNIQYLGKNEPFWTKADNFYNTVSTSGNEFKFTSTGLRNLCINRGWNSGLTDVQFNRKVGKAFEETALKFYSLTENRFNYPAPQRATKNSPNPPTQVRPDALDNYMCIWRSQDGQAHMAQLEKTFGVEVKAYNGTLELSTNSWQILGELELLRNNFDAQANSPYWKQLTNPPLTINTFKVGPVLFFITTDDTEIGQTIIDKAIELKVSIWQVKAVFEKATGKISFHFPKFVYDKSESYAKGDYIPSNYYKSLLFGGLESEVPLNLLTPIQPNFDLDPEELKP